ncbi:hypothetical protein TIFTF001_035681 [Ficus carica]|uniref:Uncharacterized protein n=1 Tax=Ficus carica TaxID=3494 RepID=A0AA88E201_FICCA|nr:hypothetical protein TIFTF001_035681 [Ficus carica]
MKGTFRSQHRVGWPGGGLGAGRAGGGGMPEVGGRGRGEERERGREREEKRERRGGRWVGRPGEGGLVAGGAGGGGVPEVGGRGRVEERERGRERKRGRRRPAGLPGLGSVVGGRRWDVGVGGESPTSVVGGGKIAGDGENLR